MSVRVMTMVIIAAWLILGGYRSACGQIELEPRLESIGELEPASDEDRYGGYEAVSLEAEGRSPVAEVAKTSVIGGEGTEVLATSATTGLPWRPCGPQQSFGGNWLFTQTFAGADFRQACARHDACLLSGCTSRKCCDKMFLWELDSACDYSAFPILCRIKARQYYAGVRLFGWMF